MTVSAALLHSADKPAGKRPYFLNPESERILAITMAVAQELAVARQRIDTLERLLEAKGLLRRDEIEGFAPSADDYAERALWSQEYINRILRIVQQEGKAAEAAAKGDLPIPDVTRELSTEGPSSRGLSG
jgi:hypothetical protein